MTNPSGVVDFFAIEAGEYVARLDALLAASGGRAPEAEPLAREARALRGSATMARQPSLAALAGAIETVAVGLRDGRQPWTPHAADALVAAVDAFKALLRRVREWSPSDDAAANERVRELHGLAAADTTVMRGAVIVPIAKLFADGDGPHVVHRNPRPPITADLRFRQAAVPLASTLRRLIGEARHATDEASRRAAGDDLRAALRDLGELAESYDIDAVANFARAREAALATLEERALDTVDSAAQALVESAGTVWARRTPAASSMVVESAAPAPRPTPVGSAPAAAAPPAPERGEPAATPPSGQALVALLETSITGLHRMVDDEALATPPGARGARGARDETPAAEPRGADVVPIDTLLYRGRAALERARELRNALRGADAPDAVLLDELYDLLDLAALEESVHA
ncbi:Hpt domain protein [Gemmatirosa kalamazoonensis]|uniref:Hpt domain protein n=1 Tax=Gemmatirosa kalamazoonensis TaxID=861299 RepID=W0RJA0_9BACT|nr:Hpt domain-containing protein [Gemmatirosa kalamazoonensis]AHG90507.1 Hpt domain protein [Gemmatirosa kalamazoonensis]